MSRDSLLAIPAPSTNSSLINSEGGQLIEKTSAQSNRTSNQSPSKSTKKVFLPAGTAFRLLGLYEDVSNLVTKKNRPNQPAEETMRKQLLIGNTDKKGPRYLKCLAQDGEQFLANKIVFIPTTQTGR